MDRVDAHQHFWTLARGDYRFPTPDLFAIYRDFGPADLKPLNERLGVTRTVLVQVVESAAETRFLLDLAAGHKMVGGVVGWVDMAAGGAAQAIAELARDPWLRGVRPPIERLPVDWMLQDALDPAYRAIIDHGLTMDALVLPVHLPILHRLLMRYPDLPVVIDHAAKPRIRDGAFAGWAADMARLAADTNAWCKVSGLVTEANRDWTVATLKPYVDHLIQCFGANRLMWGSDWPVVDMAGGHAAWTDACSELFQDLPEADRTAILGATAHEFYRLR
jgi:L-fuconolactonase